VLNSVLVIRFCIALSTPCTHRWCGWGIISVMSNFLTREPSAEGIKGGIRIKYLFLIAFIVIVIAGVAVYGYHKYTKQQQTELVQSVQITFDENDLQGALINVNKALENDPKNSMLLATKSFIFSQMGSLLFKQEEFGEKAEAIANFAVSADGNNSEAYRALGYAYEIQQRYDLAHEAYIKAIKLDPQNELAQFGNAHTHDLEGQIEKAEAGYKAALKTNPDLAEAYIGLGRIYIASGERDKAIEAFKNGLAKASNKHRKSEASASLAIIYLADYDVAAAKPYAEDAVKFDSRYPTALLSVGTLHYLMASATTTPLSDAERTALMSQSVKELKRAVSYYPDYTAAYVQMAIEFAVVGNKKGSEDLFIKAQEVVMRDITLGAREKESMQKQITDSKAQVDAIIKSLEQ
jgi:tetratricopeptide (TPR) repeat protein